MGRWGKLGVLGLALGVAVCCSDDTRGVDSGLARDGQAVRDVIPDRPLKGDTTRPDSAVSVDSSGAGRIDIYVKGDLSPLSVSDKSVGLTPAAYVIALSKYQVLTSANDPSPQLCFDHGKTPFEAKMEKDNAVGFCPTKSLKTGLYTHGRTRVDWARYTVSGTLHTVGIPAAGTFTFFRAYSNTSYQGKTYLANHGFMTFKGAVTFSIPMVYPVMPTVPGVSFSLKNGEFYWTFPYTKPLPIDHKNPGRHWARFHWKIKDSFRWLDATKLGYKKNVWDVSSAVVDTEKVTMYGVSGYFVTSSADK